MNGILDIHISCCVPLAIDDLKRRGGPLDSDFSAARKFAGDLAAKADQILYRDKETAPLVSQLVRNMAVMAFVPGGVRFGEAVYCATHFPMGVQNKGLCPGCANPNS
jgi:hypothetical protein